MTKRYPAGSEWRKWDLHVHLPGTKLTDGYDKKNGEPDWDRFAEALENSDVAVFGITDYFVAGQTLEFIKYFKQKYPRSEKLLLANVELRLNETVNSSQQMVDFHVIFSNSVTNDRITGFLSRLPTQITDDQGRLKPCSELTGKDYESATVTRADIKKAFRETFGDRAEPTDYVIFLAPANNNGLRAQSGQRRKASLADEIDKDVHAIFGKDSDNSTYFLTTGRYEDRNQKSKPKPVFGGCDAHNFADLTDWLGKAIEGENTRQVVTWVKADPTFEGLQQTLVEPGDRVSLSELMPDAKELYKVIKRVSFQGGNDFPEEIILNPNLNAVIGSRSSGKSALLAHISHAIDPDYTIKQQTLASQLRESDVGPAAGLSWQSVQATVCKVEWADGSTEGGQVIYIPQNWLYQISDNPKEVTGKIRPVLESHYPSYFREQQRLLGVVASANDAIIRAVARWFSLTEDHANIVAGLKQLGGRPSIIQARDKIKTEVETIRAANSLTAEDIDTYQKVIDDLGAKRDRVQESGLEAEQLSSFTIERSPKQFIPMPGAVSVEMRLTPDPSRLPETLATKLTALITASSTDLVTKAEAAIVTYRSQLVTEIGGLTAEIATLESDNKDLLTRHQANTALDELVKRQKIQQDSLDKIDNLEARRDRIAEEQDSSVAEIKTRIEERSTALDSIIDGFHKDDRKLDNLTFGIATGFDSSAIKELSEPFRKNAAGAYLKRDDDTDLIIDIDKAQNDPVAFMADLSSKKQKLNQGNLPVDVARRVLTATPEIRFTATLDMDHIGGFERSTMTPGKQALFALTLILGEAEERWALLIDQPEDDLDSKSIYTDIVRYLVQQKKQRQIILVTHNANLVVGADAEEVLVANRNGDDRKNKGNRTFNYLTGSLEHSKKRSTAPYELDRMGIREHAVEILDGGEEAFLKRRDKYKI